MSEIKDERNYYFDILRYVFCVVVVLLHSGLFIEYKFGNFLNYIIPSLAVPYFFALSGYYFINKLFKSNNPIKLLKEYLKKILIIYFFWSVFYFLIDLKFCDIYKNNNIKNILDFIKVYIDYAFYSRLDSYHLWYVVGLVVSCVVLCVAHYFHLSKVIVYLSLPIYVFGYIVFCFPDLLKNIPIVYDIFTIGIKNILEGQIAYFIYKEIPLFCFGYVGGAINSRIKIKNKKMYLTIILIILCILSGYEITLIQTINNNANMTNLISIPLITITYFILVLNLNNNFKLKTISKKLRDASNFTYYSHVLVLHSLLIIKEMFMFNWLNSIVSSIITLISCYIGCLFINKIMIIINENKRKKVY